MQTKYHIKPFLELGERLRHALTDDSLAEVIARSTQQNGWFTAESVRMALQALCSDMLTREALENWLQPYEDRKLPESKNVGIVMAGNLPLVGFADLLYVLVCGHRAQVKPSSKDRVLAEYVCGLLRQIEPAYVIEPLEGRPDALIATGSDSTRLHFEREYADMPALLRGSRHSIAVLSGDETPAELDGLQEDMFAYFGLGCRNVSRLFVPRDYSLHTLTDALKKHPVQHPKYLNGYRQTKALLQLTGQPFTDGGFYLLCQGEPPAEAACLIGYTRYDRPDEVDAWIAEHDDRLQCIVARTGDHPRRVSFGRAQHPRPQDYADGVDVMDFLLRL